MDSQTGNNDCDCMNIIGKSIVFIIVSLLATISCAEDKIYRHTSDKGHLEYSDRKLHDGFVRIERTWKGWIEVKEYKNWRDNRRRFQTYVQTASTEYDVPSGLINAVIHTESYFNPEIESKAGAVGLMQLMPATAERFNVSDRKDPVQNIKGGTKFLGVLLKKYDNNLELTLAAYNAGEGAVKKYGNKIPPYPETQRYVKKALKLYREYRQS